MKWKSNTLFIIYPNENLQQTSSVVIPSLYNMKWDGDIYVIEFRLEIG